MTVTKRLLAALSVVGLVGVAAIGMTSEAQAQDPYSNGPEIAVTNATPACGSNIGMTGGGFADNEDVTLTLVGPPSHGLGSVTTNNSGAFSTTVTLPANVSGPQTITAVGTTGDKAQTTVVVGPCNGISGVSTSAGNTSSSPGKGVLGESTGPASGSSGSLASTGVAVAALAALGLALIAAGFVFLGGGRRRRGGHA